MESVAWLWTTFTSLAWWQIVLSIVYAFYFVVRAYAFWDETRNGLWKGYRRVMFGFDKYFRVYHIIRILFDIPPATLGLLFPVLRKLLAFKIYEFKNN